ncbi:MAG: leucyl aminopeptidase [Cyanobacteria bacterium SZAS LIN-3]|nr:leucyl aminopeptidase [Cyanobacteria bacterium SZAS LIN-3]
MQIKLESNIQKSNADYMVVGIHVGEQPTRVLQEIFGGGKNFVQLGNAAAQVAKDECFSGKLGQVISLPTLGLVPFKRLYLYGLGSRVDAAKEDYAGYRKMGVSIAKKLQAAMRAAEKEDSKAAKTAASSSKATAKSAAASRVKSHLHTACVCLPRPAAKEKSTAWPLTSVIEAFILSAFSYDKYKSMKEAGKQAKLDAAANLSHFSLSVYGVDKSTFDQAVRKGQAVGMAVNMARGLIAEPPAYMTPSRLAVEARRIAKDHNLTVKVLEPAQIEKLGMGSFLGVARGAKEPPRFIVLKYTAPKARKTVALVGKGVTFDSGGLSLKTAGGMEHMKYDMAGAAAVLASMQVLGALKPKVSVLAVIPATENMPGSNALHPGDVLIAMNGKTIEVNNTDAEGRLILADALTYAVNEGADELIDIATLTGAVVTALGRVAAGIMGSDQKLVDAVIAAGRPSGEKYWQLPLFEEYKEALKSDIADLKNAGSRGEAGSSCAAMFLKEFTADKAWAHLDIAGVGWRESERDELCKGGIGFGIRTLCSYVLAQ